jgi:hypothetical protein
MLAPASGGARMQSRMGTVNNRLQGLMGMM